MPKQTPILYRCKCGWWSESKNFDLEYHRKIHLCHRAGHFKHTIEGTRFYPDNQVDKMQVSDL